MVNVSHEQVVANIKRLLKLRNVQGGSGPIIETIFYRMPENHFEEERFVEMWRGVVDRVHPIGGVSKSFRSTGKDLKTPIRTKACTMVRERMVVYWNGDVTICNSDVDGRHVVGNLKDRGVMEIWDSEPLVNIRAKHSSKRFESLPAICLNCDQ
jgi:radical SAM protein with 4Fe4S-binding SPASM domain